MSAWYVVGFVAAGGMLVYALVAGAQVIRRGTR